MKSIKLIGFVCVIVYLVYICNLPAQSSQAQMMSLDHSVRDTCHCSRWRRQRNPAVTRPSACLLAEDVDCVGFDHLNYLVAAP